MNQAKTPEPFWAKPVPYWYQTLESSANGLTRRIAQQKADGIMTSRAKPAFVKDISLFLTQFKSPLMLLLIGAVLLSAFLGDISDTLIILFILLASGLISFFQELNANKVVEKLQAIITLKSCVIREGAEQEILASQIVPGDILHINAGDIIPADCLLIEANELNVNEASLTGESFPVRKTPETVSESAALAQRTNCLWQGTNVVSGSGKAIIIHTGKDTVFGTVIKSAANVVETSFESGLKKFGFLLMRITLVLSVFILIVNLINHKSLIDSALFSLALAVGMAPELLPAVTTIAMSAGAKRLLNKKVIVKKLNSIQNLGEITLLCTDKTGTITEGVIEIEDIVDPQGNTSDFVKNLSYWNAFFETGYSNPIDEALKQKPVTYDTVPQRIGEIPYDFTRKKLSIAIDTGKEKLLISKGAFAQCLEICTTVRMPDGSIEDISGHRQQIEASFEQFGNKGIRAIAVCYKPISGHDISKADEAAMIFCGFILMKDPVKQGVSGAIHELQQLNIDLKIITGDNKVIARSVAQEIGIENPIVVTGQELLQTDTALLAEKVKQAHIFSEVEPQQKEQIIQALRNTHSVAYMGDGINDVSAINAADVGISVDNATDVAREAADFILLEKNLSVIADGIREGRKTFANTLKYIYISTGSTFGNMCSVAFASLLLPFLPMLPKQILLTNFLTDFPFLAIPSDNVDDEQTALPGKWDMKLIKNYMLVFGIHSSVFDLITFCTLLFYLRLREVRFQTGWFIESIFTELLIFFIIRTRHKFFKSKPSAGITLLSFAALIMTIALPYVPFTKELGFAPLSYTQLMLILLIVATYVITADILKVWFFRKHRIALSEK
ncbi:magnesium-translocating P-type ATPase [Pedobacter sp. BS3]|nr:magnesium-translocating P-type ATPase [Pedobacter sp. BS3]